jgi:ankyrin repeat protein
VNAPGADGTPALHWTVRVDDLEMASLLIKGGADVKFKDRYEVTPLYLACFNGNAAMIKLLLDAGADPNSADPTGETALMTVATVGDLESVKLLLDRGARVESTEPGFEQTALMYAVRNNHPDVVQLLVSRGAAVNARTRVGPTPVFFKPNASAAFGHGVGINRGGLPDRGSRIPIQGGMSALLYAARDGRMESAQILVKAGADVNQAEANSITPLVIAINNNQVEVARFLLDQGADFNAMDWYGRSPLWSAVELRNMDIHNATFDGWLNLAAFTSPAPGTYGNQGVNTLRAPGVVQVDIGISRTFDLAENKTLQLRAESFNLPNHTNPNPPVSTTNSGAFGKIQSAGDPRIIQFGMKLSF